jgi:hypothetical protein
MKLILFLLLLSFPILAGCSKPASTQFTEPYAFTATYTDGKHTTRMDVQYQDSVLGADGVLRPAIRVTIGEGNGARSHWLDGEFRVVREMIHCRQTPDECQHAFLDYSTLGTYSPWGIGIHRRIDGGALRMDLAEGSLEVPGSLRGQTASVQGSGFAGLRLTDLEVKSEDGWLPQSIRRGTATFELESVESGEILPEIPTWPGYHEMATRPVPRLFEGADQDVFGLGETHLQAVDRLRQGDSEAAAAIDQGCIYVYALFIPEGNQAAMPNLLERQDSITRFVDVFDHSGHGRQWTFVTSEDAFGNRDFESASDSALDFSYSCPANEPVLGSRGQVKNFLDLARKVPLTHEGMDYFDVSRPPMYGRDADHQLLYTGQFIPAGVDRTQGVSKWVPYDITWDPGQEMFYYLDVNPADVAKLDSTALV